MNRPSRWGITRLAAVFGFAALLGASSLAAQGTTGKIEGTVRDQAGAPVAGAQVLIVGSAYATTTNEQGYYFFNNIPAGVMTVRAQFIGYAPTEVRNVRVFAGQTFTSNITIEQRAVEVGGINVVAEANPLVPRDQVSSKPIVRGETIEQLPADNINQVLRLQPGVVEGNRGLVIRGGRPGEAALYVDGVLVRNMQAQFVSAGSNPGTVTLGTNALEEASVTTGAIGAEYGDAQSGVISLVSRTGGTDFSGSISYATDEIAGETYGTGLNRVEASFGGPLMSNLRFFVATTLEGRQNLQQGKGAQDIPLYVMDGLDTSDPLAPNGFVMAANDPADPLSDSTRVDIPRFTRFSEGSRRPDDAGDNMTFTTNLLYSYGTGNSIRLNYHQSRAQDRAFRGNRLYNPMSQQGARQSSRAVVLNVFQNLVRSTDRALSLEANLSYQKDQFIFGTLDPQWFMDNREPFGNFTFSSMDFLVDFDNFPLNDQLVQNVRTSHCEPSVGGRCVPLLGRTDLDLVGQYRSNPYGVNAGPNFFSNAGFAATSTGLGPLLAQESRVTGRFLADWQANRFNRLRFGGDFTRANLFGYTSSMVQQIFMDAYSETPVKMAAFAQDRIDLGDVVIELGLRYDRLNSGVLYPEIPGRIFSDPRRDGDLSDFRGQLLPNGSRAQPTANDTAVAARCAAFMAAADSAGWSTCNLVEAPAHSSLAPNVRVSFPISDRTGFRLSYAHQTQTPDFGQLVNGVNSDLNFTNTNNLFARDLDFGRSILFEFGIRHAFSPDMVLDISAYNKDKVSDITARVLPVFDPAIGAVGNINMYTNADFGNSRGIEMLLDRRVGDLFSGRLSYTYQSAKSTGSDPLEYLGTLARQTSSLTGDRAPPPTSMQTTRDNRTHTIAGTASLTFPHGWRAGSAAGSIMQDLGLFATFRFASGLGYTRLDNIGRGQQGPGTNFGLGGTADEPLNASTMPWIKNVDLRVTKGFRLGSRDLTVFGDFRNLFNFTNLVAIWAETGDVRNAEHRRLAQEPLYTALGTEAGDLLDNRPVTRGGTTRPLDGYDLSDCATFAAEGRLPNCIFLRGAERRFGDGDAFFDTEEQASAFNAWYDFFSGPQTLKGPGFNFRLGFEFNF